MRKAEVEKDAFKKVTALVDVVIQALAPTSSNLHIVVVQVRSKTLLGRQDVAMVQEQPHPATTLGTLTKRNMERSPLESPPLAGIGKAGQEQANLASSAKKSQCEEGGRQDGGENKIPFFVYLFIWSISL